MFRGVAGRQFAARMAPTWFFVRRALGDLAQSLNYSSSNPGNCGRNHRARRRIHERHEFVRKPGHGTSDANAAHVWAASNSIHPTAFANVAVHYWSPAAQFHDALRRTVNVGKVPLLVVAAAVASFVNRFAKQPFGPQLVIERNHRG